MEYMDLPRPHDSGFEQTDVTTIYPVQNYEGAWKHAIDSQDIIKQASVEAQKQEILEIFAAVVDIWKREIYTHWIPGLIHDHYCNAKAVKSCEMSELFNSVNCCILENVPFTLYKTKDGGNHPCIKGYCTDVDSPVNGSYLHHTLVKNYSDIYICTYTGKHHYCGVFCEICHTADPNSQIFKHYEKDIYNGDATIVCPLSGLCFEQQKHVSRIHVERECVYDFDQRKRDYKEYMDNCVDSNNRMAYYAMKQITGGSSSGASRNMYDHELGRKLTKSDMNEPYAGRKLTFSNENAYAASRMRFTGKRKAEGEEISISMEELHDKIKGIVTSTSRNVDALIRNLRRGQYETLKNFYLTIASVKIADMLAPSRIDQYDESNRQKTQKLIKPFTSYFNKCISGNDIPNICELSAVMKNEEKTMYIPPSIKIPTGFLVRCAIDYAKLCVNAWYAIITCSEAGRKDIGAFKFTEFVETFVSMIKSGFSVEISTGLIVPIYERDTFFNMIPNIEDEERRKGDYASKHKRKHISQMKKSVQAAVVETILKDNIHYNKLRPYTYNFETLEEKYFVPIKEWQRSKKQTKKLKKVQGAGELNEKKQTQETPQTESVDQSEPAQKNPQKRGRRAVKSRK